MVTSGLKTESNLVVSQTTALTAQIANVLRKRRKVRKKSCLWHKKAQEPSSCCFTATLSLCSPATYTPFICPMFFSPAGQPAPHNTDRDTTHPNSLDNNVLHSKSSGPWEPWIFETWVGCKATASSVGLELVVSLDWDCTDTTKIPHSYMQWQIFCRKLVWRAEERAVPERKKVAIIISFRKSIFSVLPPK